MWYLIVPPILFITSLALLFWFLSKKKNDPLVLERMVDGDIQPEPRHFLFIKEETGLRVLEKLTKRLNVVSLKFHNRFSHFSDSLRARRQRMTQPPERADQGLEETEKNRFWDRWQRRHSVKSVEISKPDQDEIPTLASEEREGRGGNAFTLFSREKKEKEQINQGEKTSRETAQLLESTRTFRRRRTSHGGGKQLSEEELIDRIARNPKDAGAYEELGDFYMETGNLSDAKACYRQVIKLLPLNREVKEKVRRLERLLVQRERNRS